MEGKRTGGVGVKKDCSPSALAPCLRLPKARVCASGSEREGSGVCTEMCASIRRSVLACVRPEMCVKSIPEAWGGAVAPSCALELSWSIWDGLSRGGVGRLNAVP